MPQNKQFKKVGEIAYSEGNTVPFDLREKCEGRVLEALRLKVPAVTNITSGGTAITLNPYTLCPSLTVQASRGGIWHQGEAYDYRVRDGLFNRIGSVTAEDAAVDNDAVEFWIDIPMIPFGARRTDFGLHLRRSGDVFLNWTWGSLTSLMAGGAGTFTTNPKVEVYAKTSKADWEPQYQYVTGFRDKSSLGTSANTDFEEDLPVAERNTNMGYTHMIVRVMDLVATSLRAHIAHGTTSFDNIRLVESGGDGEFTSFGYVNGDDQQAMMLKEFDQYDGIQAGVYPFEFLASNGGNYMDTIGASGLESLKLKAEHGAFATDGAIRTVFGYMKRLTPIAA